MPTVMEHIDTEQSQNQANEYAQAQNIGFSGTKEEYFEYRDYT